MATDGCSPRESRRAPTSPAIRLAAVALAVLGAAGCAGRSLQGAAAGGPLPGAALPEGSYRRQALYRADYEGSGTDGRMRLVLREGEGGFELQGSDLFGRTLWTLYRLAGRQWLIDHRARAYCSGGSGLGLPDLELGGLPTEALPRVLAGELPVAPPGGDAESPSLDFRDAAGRRWTGTRRDGELVSWALWDEGRPLAWWTRQPRGGVLSHRRGSQLRWREAFAEEVAPTPFAAAIPEGYDRRDCAAWDLPQLRQDQPSPAGDRPPR